MTAKIRLTYYGVEGEGKTVKEAKADAGRKIEASLTGTYSPTMLASRGWIMILWRDPHGWRSNTIVESGKEPRVNPFQSYSSGTHDYYEAYASALMHLAQMTWDGSELLPPCLEEVAALAGLGKRASDRDTAGRRLLSDFASWRGFQLAYKAAKVAGMPENERHQWACWHASEFVGKVVSVPSVPRCEVCDWPLADDVASGCVAGNCSQRPVPVTA